MTSYNYLHQGDYGFGIAGLFVCLSVSLSICLSATLFKNYERIALKFYGGVWGPVLDFDSEQSHCADSPNRESRQYWNNELPCWRFSAL